MKPTQRESGGRRGEICLLRAESATPTLVASVSSDPEARYRGPQHGSGAASHTAQAPSSTSQRTHFLSHTLSVIVRKFTDVESETELVDLKVLSTPRYHLTGHGRSASPRTGQIWQGCANILPGVFCCPNPASPITCEPI